MDFPSPSQVAHPLQQDPHRGRADDGVFDQQDPLVAQHFRQGGVFGGRFLLAIGLAFDERPPRIAIADQAFHGGQLQPVRQGVGGRFAGVRHRDHDRVVVQRHRSVRQFQPRQLFPQRLPRQVNTALVHVAGHVGEIDPFEKTVRSPRAGGKRLHRQLAPHDGHRLAGQQRLNALRRKAQVQEGHTFTGGGKQGTLASVAERFYA